MGDCSMHAMKPKQPRTCGNCGHGVQTNVFCRESDGKTAGLHSLGERGCRKWVARGDTLEQRYERLAQVARDMLRYARIRLGEHWTKEDAKACKAYEDELRALEVSVDD